MAKLNVLVLFGGVSTEHEVSVITGIQVLNALDKNKYNVIPLYITKNGKWIKGDESFFSVETFKDLKKFEKEKSEFISPDKNIKNLVSNSSGINFFKSTNEDID